MIECVRQEAAHCPMATTLTPSSPASAGNLLLIARCVVAELVAAAGGRQRAYQVPGLLVATCSGETSSAASAEAVIYEPQTSTGRCKSQPPFFGHPLREGEGCELNSALFEFEK